MNRQMKKLVKNIQSMASEEKAVLVQAMGGTEGISYDAAMDSLLDGSPLYAKEDQRGYKSYSSQVTATHKKYNGNSTYGVAPVRAVVDIRTAFISGEGISVNLAEGASDGHRKFMSDFLKVNKLNVGRLFSIVKQTEMNGYSLPYVKSNKEGIPRVYIHRFQGSPLKIEYAEGNLTIIKKILSKSKSSDEYEELSIKNPVLIRTGGDADSVNEFTTKVGSILNECDSYDKANQDLRRMNHKTSRITPTFETKNGTETDKLVKWLKAQSWKIGDSFVGTAKFKYENAGNSPVKNLQDEMGTNTKTISGVTGVPVHWFGWVDMMSNRATATELYNSVNNATIMERLLIADGIRDLIIIAQREYIDGGGKEITEVTTDFEVSLPLIDLGRFKEIVEAYSQLYGDDVISLKKYREMVPGVDPLFEEKQVEKEQEASLTKPKFTVPEEDENADI